MAGLAGLAGSADDSRAGLFDDSPHDTAARSCHTARCPPPRTPARSPAARRSAPPAGCVDSASSPRSTPACGPTPPAAAGTPASTCAARASTSPAAVSRASSLPAGSTAGTARASRPVPPTPYRPAPRPRAPPPGNSPPWIWRDRRGSRSARPPCRCPCHRQWWRTPHSPRPRSTASVPECAMPQPAVVTAPARSSDPRDSRRTEFPPISGRRTNPLLSTLLLAPTRVLPRQHVHNPALTRVLVQKRHDFLHVTPPPVLRVLRILPILRIL